MDSARTLGLHEDEHVAAAEAPHDAGKSAARSGRHVRVDENPLHAHRAAHAPDLLSFLARDGREKERESDAEGHEARSLSSSFIEWAS
jgi:chromosome condensin MukBEF MukE localization factor